jgi:hypothetical protein
MEITNELRMEYYIICSAGFRGTIEEYIVYKENYDKNNKTKKELYKNIAINHDDENV